MSHGSLNRRTMMIAAAAMAATMTSRAFAAENDPLIAPPDRETRVPVRGGTIYVRVNGDLRGPAKPLLLICGGPGGACWQMLPAIPLAAKRAIILYDQLDTGHSDAPGKRTNWSVERFASEIDAIRAALDLDDFHLLGHSWGGMIAARYASRQPLGLRSLILQGTPLSAGMFVESERSLFGALPSNLREAALANSQGKPANVSDLAAANEAFLKQHIARTNVNKVAGAYMEGTPLDRGNKLGQYLEGESGFRFTGALASYDDEHLLDAVAAPTLLLCGSDDIITARSEHKLLPRLRYGSVIEVPGAGHMIQFDNPNVWRRTIGDFVSHYD